MCSSFLPFESKCPFLEVLTPLKIKRNPLSPPPIMADDKPRPVNAMDHVDDAHTEKPSDAAEATHVVGDALLLDKHGKIRRLPIPSNDPNDPLNYKTWEKAATIFCCCWFSMRISAFAHNLTAESEANYIVRWDRLYELIPRGRSWPDPGCLFRHVHAPGLFARTDHLRAHDPVPVHRTWCVDSVENKFRILGAS